jgi:hypothetical protein
MERPALQRLLADIRAGRVEIVVVYKVDRLTRSLADFARLVEIFDTCAVSLGDPAIQYHELDGTADPQYAVVLSPGRARGQTAGESGAFRVQPRKRLAKKGGLAEEDGLELPLPPKTGAFLNGLLPPLKPANHSKQRYSTREEPVVRIRLPPAANQTKWPTHHQLAGRGHVPVGATLRHCPPLVPPLLPRPLWIRSGPVYFMPDQLWPNPQRS